MKTHNSMLLLAAALLAFAAQANAATITGVSIIDYSSQYNADYGAVKAIDGSGLGAYTPGGQTTHATASGNTWMVAAGDFSDGNVFIEFDLGDNYDLSFFDVWNFNQSPIDRGAKDVTISVASTLGGTFTSLGGFVFDQAPGSATTAYGQTVDLSSFTAADNVRAIRFDITTSYGGGYPGLSEVVFNAVPEPSAFALLAGCFGLTWVMLRRRR